jgi:GMP synthase (glutamine-hydrolysing)
MILLISTCAEALSENEFVLPIANIVKENYQVKHYTHITEEDIKASEKIIICGTSLKDNNYLDKLDRFSWIDSYNNPILGICSGMQIISLMFGAKLKKEKEIGMIQVMTTTENPLFTGEFSSYALHGNSIFKLKEFIILAKSKTCVQAIKHKRREIYGVLFHPEIRNIEIIEKFLAL